MKKNLKPCVYKHRKLWSLHDGIATNVCKTEFLLVLGGLGLDDAAYEFLYLRDKPYQDERVSDIEACMESRKDNGQAGSELSLGKTVVIGIVIHKRAHHIHKGIEETKYPNNTYHTEHQVRTPNRPCRVKLQARKATGREEEEGGGGD